MYALASRLSRTCQVGQRRARVGARPHNVTFIPDIHHYPPPPPPPPLLPSPLIYVEHETVRANGLININCRREDYRRERGDGRGDSSCTLRIGRKPINRVAKLLAVDADVCIYIILSNRRENSRTKNVFVTMILVARFDSIRYLILLESFLFFSPFLIGILVQSRDNPVVHWLTR